MLKFFAEKMWVAFAVQKLLTFFQQKNIRILCIESTKTVNEMTLNEIVKLTTLWTTGPSILQLEQDWIDTSGQEEYQDKQEIRQMAMSQLLVVFKKQS